MSNEIAIRDTNHAAYIDNNLSLIANQHKLSNSDLANFAIQCKRTGLDPITRQIYAIPMQGKLQIMASIDGLRLIAERSGAYEGQTAPQWCGADGKWVDVWLSEKTPRACRIGVYKTKFREALYAIALFEEYAGRHLYDDNFGKYKKGDLTHMWAKMPALMISKVAESLALRKAFPNEMSGIYSDEEMQQATNAPEPQQANHSTTQTITITPKPIESSNTESYDFENYIIQLGKSKMTGTKLKDHSNDWLIKTKDSAVKYHSDNNKQYHANTAQFIEMVDAYIESQINKELNPPKLSDDKIPF